MAVRDFSRFGFTSARVPRAGRQGQRLSGRSMMRRKVFHGTNSLTWANSVLPTFMHRPGSFKPESIANRSCPSPMHPPKRGG